MIRKHLQRLHFKTDTVDYSSDEIRNYCSNLYTYKTLSTHYDFGEDDIIFIGKKRFKKVDETYCKVYNKCIFRGKVLHSINYTNVTKTNDSTVQLHSNNFGQILDIIKIGNQCHLKLSKITTFTENPFNVPHIKKIFSEDFEDYTVVPITEVKCKIVLVNIRTSRYLCQLPNDFEVQ